MTKKKEGMFNDLMPSFGMAGSSMGMSIIGGKLGSHLPAGTPNPLTSGGKALSKFVPVTTSLGASAMTMKQLKKLIKAKNGLI